MDVYAVPSSLPCARRFRFVRVVALRLLLAVFLTPTCEPEALSQTKDASPAQQSQEGGASAAAPVIKAKVNEVLEQSDGAAARPARDRGSFPRILHTDFRGGNDAIGNPGYRRTQQHDYRHDEAARASQLES